MTQTIWWHLRHGWRSVDECTFIYKEQSFYRYVLQSIYCFHFYCKRSLNLYFYHAIRVTVHLLFSLLLPKKLKSVFLPRYESLKLNHYTNYLMTSEDTVEDPLISFQFFIKSNSFIVTCYSPSTVFTFIAKKAWISISTTLWIFKTKPWHKLFDDIWRHDCRSADECSNLYKQ